MRIFDKEHKLIKIVCNQCGGEVRADGDIVKKEFLSVRKEWGYFSKRDLEVHEFAICESCYEKMIDQFVIPVKKTEKIEVLGEDLI